MEKVPFKYLNANESNIAREAMAVGQKLFIIKVCFPPRRISIQF